MHAARQHTARMFDLISDFLKQPAQNATARMLPCAHKSESESWE
jgi:hypothetical protein